MVVFRSTTAQQNPLAHYCLTLHLLPVVASLARCSVLTVPSSNLFLMLCTGKLACMQVEDFSFQVVYLLLGKFRRAGPEKGEQQNNNTGHCFLLLSKSSTELNIPWPILGMVPKDESAQHSFLKVSRTT